MHQFFEVPYRERARAGIIADMRIAMVSTPLTAGRVQQNIENVQRHVGDTQGQSLDLYLYPENNLFGGFWRDYDRSIGQMANEWPFDRLAAEIAKISEQYQTAICCGCVEEDDGYYLTHFIADQGTIIGKQRKLHPLDPLKADHLTAGTQITDIDFRGVRAHILACSDFCFPEAAVMSAMQEPDLVLCPTDTYRAGRHEVNVVTTFLKARALDTGAFVFCSFGDSESDIDRLISCAAYDGNGRELAYKTKGNGDLDITPVEFEPVKAKQVWGGSRMRAAVLADYLQNRID
jgi:predicted amidohydrolase